MDIDKITERIASEKIAKDSPFLKNLIAEIRQKIDRCKAVAKEFSHNEQNAEEAWKILKVIPELEKVISNISAVRLASKIARAYPPHYFTRADVHIGPSKYGLIAIDDKDLTGEGLIAKMNEWKAVEGGVPESAWDDMVAEMKKKGVRPPAGIKKVSSVAEKFDNVLW